jgi:hypothetical protein
MSEPWNRDQRRAATSTLKRAVARLAKEAGASGAVAIAFYQEGDAFHVIDASHGNVPGGPIDVYLKIRAAKQRVAEGGGGFTQ